MPSPTIVYASTTASTIQAAWDSLLNKTPLTPVTIEVLAGTYAEAVVLSEQPYAHAITIQGDTRAAAGSHFTTTGSITKSGSNCTITLVNTPPADFTSSDHIIVGGANNAANVGRFPIVSIDTGLKTVTYTNASGVAEAVVTNTRVVFCPDRIIDFGGFIHGVTSLCATAPHLTGFTILASGTSSNGIFVPGPGALEVSKIAVWNVGDFGFYAADAGQLTAVASCSAVKCEGGFTAARRGYLNAPGTYVADSSAKGYLATMGGMVSTVGGIAVNSVTGFEASYGSVVYAQNSVATRNTTGYLASYQSTIYAPGTSANNSSSTTYSPGTSGAMSATGGIILFT
jgi:hypothetical protein